MFSIVFSASGAAVSHFCMQMVKRTDKFSPAGVSITGGVAHNAGQVAAAAVVVENVRIGYYFLPLAIAGIITGAVIGVISGILIPRLLPLRQNL